MHLRPETREKLERLGLARATAYKTMALTGLRLGEMSSIRVCDLILDGPAPHIVLDARHEKARRGASIPLRADLVEDLLAWLVQHPGMPDRLLFRLASNQVKTFNSDIALAGIPKMDDRGRTACVHSRRHTFATLLSRGGVTPRVAQAAVRHSMFELTMNTYTDPRLLDVAGALAVPPSLPLHAQTTSTATGT